MTDTDDAEDLADRVQAGELRLYELEEHADADTAARARRVLLERETDAELDAVGDYSFPAERADPNVENMVGAAQIPMGVAGPVPVDGGAADGDYYLPLATTEGALVASVNRGLTAVRKSGGATARVTKSRMTRAPVFRVADVAEAGAVVAWVRDNEDALREAAEATTSHGELHEVTPYVVGDSVFLRFGYDTKDAMGMNMATIATQAACEVVESETSADLVALSGNLCTDKKPAAINAVEGRGRTVSADVVLSRELVEDRFKTTGLMHLLAVSGLHVFLVGMVLYVLLRPILMRFRFQWRSVEVARAAVTVLVLGLYVLLTGSRPSVVRSAVMATLFIGGILFQRSSHPLNTLGVAALLLLVVRPPAVFDVGFQLSMAAVAALVAVHPRLMDWVPESWTDRTGLDWLVTTISTSAAATIGAAPVLLYHFGWVSGAGLLLNLVGIPCTGIAMTAAVAMITFGGLWSMAGGAFGSVADLAVKGLLFASRIGAEWFGGWGLRIADPSGWIVGALIVGTIAVAQWPRPRYRWRCLVCALLLVTAGVWSRTIGVSAKPTLDVVFFDVGQGDAILVTTPTDRRMLVDTGPRPAPGDAAALNSVLPYLRQRGVDHLNTVVISHPDEDHLGGLPAILREIDVGCVVHSGQRVDTELFAASRRLIRRTNTATDTVRRGEVLKLGASVELEILSPPSRPARYGIEGENEKSVVLRLVYGAVDVLLPGDIERSAETTLVDAYGRQLRSRVVKIPHHGSSTSSSQEFVHQVLDSSKSTEAVVSVGRFNQFGMPDSTVLKRWRSEGASVSSTARQGAVWLRTDGSDVWKVAWQ